MATYYHVTFQTRVPAILEQGLLPGKRRNWSRAMGGKQGSTAFIYLFEDANSAVQWACSMEYHFDKPIDILEIVAPPGLLQSDDHVEMQLKGLNAITTDEAIPASCIRRAIPLTLEMKRAFVATRDIDMSDW